MNLRLPVLSDGSDHGTTTTGSSAEHSADHSESITNYLSVTGGEAVRNGNLAVGQKEAQQRMFGPVAIVAAAFIGLGEKGAVASVFTFFQRDVGIRFDLGAALIGDTDEGVVQCIQDQGRHCNVGEQAGGASAIVVIIRAGEAGIECRDAIVELTQRADSNGVVAIVSMREEHGFAAKAADKIVQKLQLVETVLRQMQRISRRLA